MYKRKGSRYWWTVVGGVRTSLRTEDKADAEALEAKLKHERYQRTYLGVKPFCSWEKVCVRWEQEKSYKTSWEDDVRYIKFWGRFFRGRDIRTITREEVDEICRQEFQITKQPSPQNNTATHHVKYLGAILNAACRDWRWAESVARFFYYPAPDGRKRWLSVGEWRALEEILPTYLRLAARFALATGLRRSKLTSLRWDQVDSDKQSLSFGGTSNKLGNTIPLNDTAMSVLEEIQASPVRHMNLVFTRPDGTALHEYERGWYVALEKCGLRRIAAAQRSSSEMGEYSNTPSRQAKGRARLQSEVAGSTPVAASAASEDVCWHTLRHTWASWLAQAGVPEWARKRLGGWASRETVDRYSHLSLEALRPYAAVIDDVLKGDGDVRTNDGAKRAGLVAS